MNSKVPVAPVLGFRLSSSVDSVVASSLLVTASCVVEQLKQQNDAHVLLTTAPPRFALSVDDIGLVTAAAAGLRVGLSIMPL